MKFYNYHIRKGVKMGLPLHQYQIILNSYISTMKKKILFAFAALLLGYGLTAQTISIPLNETFDVSSSSFSQWDYSNGGVAIVVPRPDLGAYGDNTGCLMYNFYNSQGQPQYNVFSPLFENPANSGMKLSFDFAGADRYTMPIPIQVDFAKDVIILQYSKDNGTTYNTLDTFEIDTAGILNTGGILPGFFTPNDTQWVTISDIKLPRGTNKVAFVGVKTNSIAGNMGFLDNVKIDTCLTPLPTGDTLQSDTAFHTVADLQISGENLHWYAEQSSYDTLNTNTPLTDSTFYYVTQTIGGCESSPLKVYYTIPTVDTTDTSTAVVDLAFSKTTISPNPFKNFIQIQTDLKINSLLLYDVAGRIVKRFNPSDKLLMTDELNAGIYFLKINSTKGSKTYKLLK